MTLFELLKRVALDLQQFEVSWALIGGLAVGARCEPRFTRDLDIAVAVGNDSEAEQLVRTLCSHGYQLTALLEQAKTGQIATARLLPSFDDRLVDLLFASSGIEADVVDQAESRCRRRPQRARVVRGLGLPGNGAWPDRRRRLGDLGLHGQTNRSEPIARD